MKQLWLRCSGAVVAPSAPVASAPVGPSAKSNRKYLHFGPAHMACHRKVRQREREAGMVIIHPWKQATAGGPPADGAQREHIKAAVDVYEIYRRYLHRCNSQGIGKPLLNLYDAMTINYY